MQLKAINLDSSLESTSGKFIFHLSLNIQLKRKIEIKSIVF